MTRSLVVQIFIIIFLCYIVFKGEYQDNTRNEGYSSCDCDTITKLDPKKNDTQITCVRNIKELIDIYKGNVLWRKTVFISLLITILYTTFVGTFCDWRKFFLLLFTVFFFCFHMMHYTIFHSFLPINRIIKKNLSHIEQNYMNTL